MSARSALIIMDFQNDFCLPQGIGAEYRGDLSRLDGVAERIAAAANAARRRGVEVVFVKFLGDEKYQGASWRARDARLGKKAKCLEGSWGAELHKLQPNASERTFSKRAHFDAFLCEAFAEFVVTGGFRRLYFAGIYCDVCLDSTARTAFQKGYHVSLLRDCTTTLHLPEAECLNFMRKVYGAETITHTEFIEALAL